MVFRKRVCLTLLAWAAVLLVCRPLLAQQSANEQAAPARLEITGVRVGFNGLYKVGLWTPVTVFFKGGPETVTGLVQLTLPDGDGLPSRVTSQRPYQVTAGQTASVMLFAKFGRIESELRAALVDAKGEQVFALRRFDSVHDPQSPELLSSALFSGQQLVVTIGSSIGIEDAIKLHLRDEKATIAHTRLENLDQLPTRWYGYEGVDSLVLSTSRAEIYRKLTEQSDQLKALEEWVERGGRLVISAATRAPELLQDGPLARFAPGELIKVTTLTRTSELESYSETQEPIVFRRGSNAAIPVAQFGAITGRIEAPDSQQTELPLVVRRPFGLGEVVYVAVDLDQPPLVEWKGRGQFVSKLIGLPAAGSDASTEAGDGGMTSTGLTDLSSQLRGALDQFDDIVLVPFWVVASLIFLYIVLIGPGDYFLVRNVLKRMELTWITFPAIVLVFSGGAYFAATQLKGNRLQINQVDLVDTVLDERRPQVRGTTWLNVFSPRAETYHLTLAPHGQAGQPVEEDESSVLLSWLGLPGSALGGMDPKTGQLPLTDQPYDFSPDLEELIGMPIHVWSTKSLTAQWSMPAPFGMQADLKRAPDDTLIGELTSELSVPLKDCWLAYDRWVYPLGDIAPSATIDLADRWKEREVLSSRLTRNRMEYDEQKKQHISVSSPYDRESFDVPTILREMMFYEASGGYGYAGLLNRYQHTVDLSGHLRLGRAIFIGMSDQAAAQLRRNTDGQSWQTVSSPQDKHWTCYRYVIPIKPAERSAN
jgi:hypothetical protein